MATVVLPAPLAARAGGQNRLGVAGATAGEVLRALERAQPALKGWMLDERGRLREHVRLFCNRSGATLEDPVDEDDELYVVQAISGGRPDEGELLVGTRKGLIVLRGARGGTPRIAHRAFPGETVEYAMRDPRSARTFAAVTHGQFGPRLFWSDDPTGEWRQADGPAFPEDAGAAVSRIWIVTPGEREGLMWAGVAPAALFRSEDGGLGWELVRPLWEQPTRPDWEGGLGGLALHSICPWPGEPERLAIAISAVGVWTTDDGGASWTHHHRGLVPRYLPEEARAGTLQHCVHKMERARPAADPLHAVSRRRLPLRRRRRHLDGYQLRGWPARRFRLPAGGRSPRP